jgi:hypothetical protein
VLLDPLGDAFGEGEVVERIAEAADDAFDLEDFVDGAGVVDAFGADEADVEGRDLGVLEPGAEEMVSSVASVDWESKTWMSSDQETLARQSGRSRCSSRVRMRTETMWDLWYRDGARGLSGEKLRESEGSATNVAVRVEDGQFAL